MFRGFRLLGLSVACVYLLGSVAVAQHRVSEVREGGWVVVDREIMFELMSAAPVFTEERAFPVSDFAVMHPVFFSIAGSAFGDLHLDLTVPPEELCRTLEGFGCLPPALEFGDVSLASVGLGPIHEFAGASCREQLVCVWIGPIKVCIKYEVCDEAPMGPAFMFSPFELVEVVYPGAP